jgi:hypothetical protein
MHVKLALRLTILAVTVVFTFSQFVMASLKNIGSSVQENYGKLPLSFEVNQGQTQQPVKFLAHAPGYTLFLTPTEAVINLTHAQKTSSLRLHFSGANPNPVMAPGNPVAGISNYFVGNDPAKWITHVPHYGEVTYHNLYPGVDAVYYGNQQQLEFDLRISPGIDPDIIKLTVAGADKVELTPQGNLVLTTAAGSLAQYRPQVYQEVKGKRRVVAGKYVLIGRNQVGLQIGQYDHRRLLIVDPVLRYSTYLGGSSRDFGHAIAVDVHGSAYVTGATFSSDFPVTSNAFQTTKPDFAPAFVTKLSPDGSNLVYSTFLGGTNGFEDGRSIVVDLEGNAYIGGVSHSTNFPTTPGAFQTTTPKFFGLSGFVTKLSPDGSRLVYSTYLTGSGLGDGVEGIAIDFRGHAFVTGGTSSIDFPTKNAFQPTLQGGADAFVTELDPTGSNLIYSTFLGGNSSDSGSGIAVDLEGNAYVTGGTNSTDFPTKNALQPTLHGQSDAFVTKFDPSGRTLVYSTYLGGTNGDESRGIAVNLVGEAYVTGTTNSTDFPVRNAIQPTFGGASDVFVAKFSRNGSTLIFSTYLGGNSEDDGSRIAVDLLGNAYIVGTTFSPDFPTANAFQPAPAGPPLQDAFVTALSSDGSALIYSSYLGGSAGNEGNGIAVDLFGNAYLTGSTTSTNFPTTPGAFQTTPRGGENAFVSKVSVSNRNQDQ